MAATALALTREWRRVARADRATAISGLRARRQRLLHGSEQPNGGDRSGSISDPQRRDGARVEHGYCLVTVTAPPASVRAMSTAPKLICV